MLSRSYENGALTEGSGCFFAKGCEGLGELRIGTQAVSEAAGILSCESNERISLALMQIR